MPRIETRTSKPRTSNLFTLPAELRNVIYSHLVFHHETNGIISPIIPSNKCATLIDGERYYVSNGYPDLEVFKQDGESLDSLVRREKAHEDHYNNSSNARHNAHFCTPRCLLQPTIASVNRQLRIEALPVFYGVNRIHFEMLNFNITSRLGLRHGRDSWSPVAWWRAIGDTNLRAISMFSITCLPTAVNAGTERRGLLTFEIRQTENTTELRVTRPTRLARCETLVSDTPTDGKVLPPCLLGAGTNQYRQYRTAKRDRLPHYIVQDADVNEQFASLARPHMEALRANGLHVAGLEKLVIAMEPWNAEYVVDHSAMDDDVHIGIVMSGSGKWMGGDLVKYARRRMSDGRKSDVDLRAVLGAKPVW